jgi:hypothetical protein
MQTIACIIRDYNSATDTCTVEVQGAGIVDLWLDGVKIDGAVSRGQLAGGTPAVLSTADPSRLCDAIITAINTPTSVGVAIQKTQSGRTLVQLGGAGTGSASVSFPAAFSTVPSVYATADNGAAVSISAVGFGSMTVSTTGTSNGFTYVSWTATGGA